MWILMWREEANPGTWNTAKVESLEHGITVQELMAAQPHSPVIESKIKQRCIG